jgi:eukaryotic-like serine/threonine-protein kinase
MQLPSDRVKALATRSRFRIGGALVQPDRLLVSIDGREIEFEPRMMEVLVALAEHAGEVVTAEQLLIEVWRGTFYGDNPVHKAIAYLRRVLGDDLKSPRYIETIRKRGYRLVAKVTYPEDYRRVTAQTAAWRNDSPYVGLAAFDSGHAGVFFGRSRATAELLAAMRHQIDNQRRFMLIVGASGCGKSSLLNAGAIPLLCQNGGFDGMRALTVARCDLAGIGTGDALPHLAAALSTWILGDRPVFPPGSATDLADHLRRSPELVTATIEDALNRLSPRALLDQPHTHLLLLIDHAEALVASTAHRDERDMAFSAALHHLCESPRVMVAMIVRSDFYLSLIETYPLIAARKLGEGHYDVLTPLPGEIAQIIRIPASLAGLTFEEDPQTAAHLDDVLRDAATEHTDALPLLQHTLQALYERRSESGELRFEAYREIGGLEGALAHRAEEAFAGLDAVTQNTLGQMFAKLIVMQQDTDAVSARRVHWQVLDRHARALAEAFVKARLFVGDLSDGEAGFRVAHEALLRQWPRAREWIHDNRRLLQAKARMRRAATRWVEEGRSADHLLNPGRPLHEAREAARALPGDFSQDEHAFLNASERQYLRKRRLRTAGIAGLAISAVISASFAFVASQARNEAERRREEALQLSDFMLTDLADKLRPLGNLKLLSSISAKALTVFEGQPSSEMRIEDLINRSRAFRTAGEVMLGEGKHKEAERAFVRANEVARNAIASAPESVAAHDELGMAESLLGLYYYRQKRLEKAQHHWSKNLQIYERLVRMEPRNAHFRSELSSAFNNLGGVARDNGRIGEAKTLLMRSAAIKSSLLSADPQNDSLRFELIDTLSWISSADELEGRLQDSASGYAKQIAMLRMLVAKKPDALVWQRTLATQLLSDGRLAISMGNLDAARSQIGECISRLSKLTELEPEHMTWRRDLALAHIEASEIARIRKDNIESMAHASAAQKLIRGIMTSTEASLALRRTDAYSRVLIARHRLGAVSADTEWDGAIHELERVADQSNKGLYETIVLSNALIARGRYRAGSGRAAEATSDWERAIDRLKGIAASSKNPNVVAPWVHAHLLLDRRPMVETKIAWLASISYRNPDYLTTLGRNAAAPNTGARSEATLSGTRKGTESQRAR